jgi:peptide/nickel transport system substrate-binding protein
MRRARVFLLSLVTLSLLLLSACGSKPATNQSPAPANQAPAQAPGQAPAKGPASYPLLRVASGQEPPGLDIMWQTANITQDIMQHVYEFLFTMDGNLEFKPMLAEKMDVSADGKTFTIALRKGVLFHNGKEMTAEDVIASMNRWVRLDSRAQGFMKDKDAITAPDKYTVVVKFKQPNGAFLSAIAIHNNVLAIMPKEIVEKYWSPDPRGTEITDPADMIGTGPYKVKEWKRDQYVSLVKFDTYAARSEAPSGMWGKRTAYADEIRFMTVKDDQTRLNGLIGGEYDVAHVLNPAQHAQVKANPNMQPIIMKPGSAPAAVFNKSPGNLFNNEKLRNAARLSIDYAKVLAGTFDDEAFYRFNPALAGPEWGFWYNTTGVDGFGKRDLEKAKQLMTEAGYKGEKIRWITTKDYDYMYRSALVASEQMKEAGFNVELIVSDWPTVIANRGKKDAYEIFTTGIGFGGDPTSTAAFTPNWPGFYDDPENNANYNALVTTVDPAKRKQLFEEQQRLFLTKNPYLKFGDMFNFRAARKEVKGLYDKGPAYYWNVWIEK